MLDALDVSPATALVAAGLMVAATALVDALHRPYPLGIAGPGGGAVVPVSLPALLRPAVALLVLAVAADGGVPVGIGAALGAALAAVVAATGGWRWGARGRQLPHVVDWARWAFAAVAVAGGVDLVVHGVLSV